MASRDEALRALEKKWRDESVSGFDGDRSLSDMWTAQAMRSCADELATLIAELGQEVGAVAWPSERVSIADPHDPGYRIVGFKISESHPWHGKYGLSEPLNALDRAISTSPAHTSEARDGVSLIAAERRRQMESEGWSLEHDDAYEINELACAAACYVVPPQFRDPLTIMAELWPWDESWWKPGDRIRELAKAGALIAAEIDRLERAAMRQEAE